jgi:hypothetical protein
MLTTVGVVDQILESLCPADSVLVCYSRDDIMVDNGCERLTGCRPRNNKSILRYDPMHKTYRLRRLPDKHVMAAQPQTLRKQSLQQRLLNKLVDVELETRCLALLYLFANIRE